MPVAQTPSRETPSLREDPGPAAPWLRARRWLGRPAVRRTSLALALVVFTGGIVLAWSRLPVPVESLRVPAVAGIVLLTGLSVLVSAWQLAVLARAGGRPVGLRAAVPVVVYGALSGLLPISSGTLVRGGALVAWGVGVRRAATLLLVDGLIWLAAGSAVTASAMFLLGATAWGWGSLGASAAALAAAGGLGRGVCRGRDLALLGVIRGAGVVVDVSMLGTAFALLGMPADPVQMAAMAAAGPAASLLFFLPAGLGAKEAAAAGLAAVAGVPAATAFLAAAVARVVALTTLLAWEGLSRSISGLRTWWSGRVAG